MQLAYILLKVFNGISLKELKTIFITVFTQNYLRLRVAIQSDCMLKFSSLEHRRIIADQSFLFNIFDGDIHVDFASIFNILPPTVTRFHNMRLLRPRTNYKTTDQTFIVQVVSICNSLLPDILSFCSSRAFRLPLLRHTPDPQM